MRLNREEPARNDGAKGGGAKGSTKDDSANSHRADLFHWTCAARLMIGQGLTQNLFPTKTSVPLIFSELSPISED
jgi:hypothetical protein